jgi:hypothetical protein
MQLHIKLTVAEHRALRRAAEAANTTMSMLIRKLIREAIRQ